MHRIGRTGRAGRTGEAILFVTPRERRMLVGDREGLGPSGRGDVGARRADEVNARRAGRFAQADHLEHGLAAVPRVPRPGRGVRPARTTSSMTDVAAALAVMSQDDKEFFLRPDPPQGGARARRRETPSPAASPPASTERPAARRGRCGLPRRGRQASQDRPVGDRRRARQRGRPQALRLRQDHDRPWTTRSSSCRPTCPTRSSTRWPTPDLRQAHRPPARRRPAPAASARVRRRSPTQERGEGVLQARGPGEVVRERQSRPTRSDKKPRHRKG